MLTIPHQVADQKWLDGLMKYVEELKSVRGEDLHRRC